MSTAEKIRESFEKSICALSQSAELTQKALNQFADAVKACEPLVNGFLSQRAEILNASFVGGDQAEGQHHLEIGETEIQSTGNSVSIDDVLAKIDKALQTDKE